MIIFIFLKLMGKCLTTHIGPNLSIDSTGTQQELGRNLIGTWWVGGGGCGGVS